MRKFTLISILVLLFFSQNIYSQRVLKGRITDNDGEPLPGVNIYIRGTNEGTITDLDGFYSITVYEGDVLVISFIGLQTREIEINDESFRQLSFNNEGLISENEKQRRQSEQKKENEKKIRKLHPRYYEDPPFNDSTHNSSVNNVERQDATYLPVKNNINIKYLDKNNSYGEGMLKKIEYDQDLKTYRFSFVRPFRNHEKHFEFNSTTLVERVLQLPELQSSYSLGIPQNGSFVYTSPLNNNSLCWGPDLSNLEYNGLASDFYKSGDIVEKGTGNGQPVSDFNRYNYFKTGIRLKNSLEYHDIFKYNDYYSIKYINSYGTGIMPGSSDKGHSLVSRFKTGHIDINAFYASSKADNQLLGANYARVLNAIYTTPPEFDNSNGYKTNAAIKNQAAYLTPGGNQRSFNTLSVENPYWLTAIDMSQIITSQYGTSVSYKNHFSYEWDYSLNISYNYNNNTYKNGYVSFFYPQNGWMHENEDKNINIRGEAELQKEFDLRLFNDRLRFDNFIRYIYSYTDYLFEKTEYNLNYLSPYYSFAGEQTDFFNRKNYRTIHELIINHSNTSSFDNFPMYYGASLNIYQSTTSSDISFLPSVIFMFKFDELSTGLTDLFPFKLYFQYANSINETDFQNRSSHLNLLNYNVTEFKDYTERLNVVYNNKLQPSKTNNYEVGINFYSFLFSNFSLDIEYYINKTRDANFPIFNGVDIMVDNLADVTTEGIEARFVININRYKGTFVFNKCRSKVDKLLNGALIQPIAGFNDVYKSLVEGEEVGVIVGSRFSRASDGQLVIGAEGYPVVDPEPGIIGNPNPDWVLNFNNQISIWRFMLYFDFEYKKGGQVWNGTKNVLNYHGITKEAANSRNVRSYVFQGVTQSGEPNTVPVDFANPAENFSDFRYIRYGYSGVAEDAIEDASWFKLKKIAITYNFDRWLLSFIRICDLKLSFWIENVFINTPYSGVDPQSTIFGYDETLGMDLFNAPGTRKYGFNINLTF